MDMFSDVIPNPTIAVVQQGLQAFQRSGADYLIAHRRRFAAGYL
ncbi:Lactaldehyde reductase [Klebsiella pneumoniae]|uniref:Lactaldehyde reductase n=1 Tax=Klebsiella pneumoniae TaxID=573 RepID=A0A377WNB8_KLEPN|nr:Lactaldehyde reductase [Klebsiella pneumoniae]